MYEGHLPVLVDEVIEMLAPAPGSLHIDATLGGGGHTERILEAANPDGRLLGLDADPAAIARVEARFRARFGARLVLRQANFVRFERAAHAAIGEGASVDDLNSLYLENLAEQFGDSLEVTPHVQYEWLSIPHIFHTPFYCYAYSFGQLLVLALYRRYLEEGEAFKPGYLRLLAHGGSARPAEILAEAGIDMTDPAFWRGGVKVVEDRLAELVALGV